MVEKQKQLRLQEPRIFLSYAKEDKERVKAIYRRLQSERINAWLDLADLLPGQDWDKVIIGAIRSARFVIVFLSTNSISKHGYVQKEIREALDAAEKMPDGEIFIIPVRLEECFVPDRIAKWQWIDLYRPHGVKKIINTLKVYLGQEIADSHKPALGNRGEAPSKDSILDHLLVNKFRRKGIFAYTKMSSGQVAVTDSVFLEFRRSLPKVFLELKRDLGKSWKFTPSIVSGALPPARLYRKKKNLLKGIQLTELFPNAYLLISKGNIRCYVDKEYFNFILEKYPFSEIYLIGDNSPVIIEESGAIRCVFMALKTNVSTPHSKSVSPH